MLRDDVIEAVAAGKFHVHPVAHIEEGIEILTGVTPPVCRDGQGDFDPAPFSRASTTACARWPQP